MTEEQEKARREFEAKEVNPPFYLGRYNCQGKYIFPKGWPCHPD